MQNKAVALNYLLGSYYLLPGKRIVEIWYLTSGGGSLTAPNILKFRFRKYKIQQLSHNNVFSAFSYFTSYSYIMGKHVIQTR